MVGLGACTKSSLVSLSEAPFFFNVWTRNDFSINPPPRQNLLRLKSPARLRQQIRLTSAAPLGTKTPGPDPWARWRKGRPGRTRTERGGLS